jgi:hypothetical protein
MRKADSNLWVVRLTNRAYRASKVADLINYHIGLRLVAWHTAPRSLPYMQLFCQLEINAWKRMASRDNEPAKRVRKDRPAF